MQLHACPPPKTAKSNTGPLLTSTPGPAPGKSTGISGRLGPPAPRRGQRAWSPRSGFHGPESTHPGNETNRSCTPSTTRRPLQHGWRLPRRPQRWARAQRRRGDCMGGAWTWGGPQQPPSPVEACCSAWQPRPGDRRCAALSTGLGCSPGAAVVARSRPALAGRLQGGYGTHKQQLRHAPLNGPALPAIQMASLALFIRGSRRSSAMDAQRRCSSSPGAARQGRGTVPGS